MVQLPYISNLPVNLLAACFNNTSATYKFYWFLSILQSVEKGSIRIPKRELFSRMISNAWYTINYFHVSFGKQDKLHRAVLSVKDYENLNIDDNRGKIFNRLINTNCGKTLQELYYFNNQVPHWFLSPWFPGKSKTEIYTKSQNFGKKCLYALHRDELIINPDWINYLRENV